MQILLRRLRNFWRRPAPQRALIVQAFFALTGARLALLVLPMQRIRKLRRSAAVTTSAANSARPSPQEVIDAVRLAARDVRRADCFALALATRFLLGRNGYPAQIRVSVKRGAGDKLVAHAWVATHGNTAACGVADLPHHIDQEIADFEI